MKVIFQTVVPVNAVRVVRTSSHPNISKRRFGKTVQKTILQNTRLDNPVAKVLDTSTYLDRRSFEKQKTGNNHKNPSIATIQYNSQRAHRNDNLK
ncbi:unnamed protein product, partial [Adineta ricciae]